MGSLERRAREREETRRRILDAARELFVQRGYEATSMRAIADKIEYTPTAIYHHFKSKEALLSELCNADFRVLAAAFRRTGRIDDPIERLHRIGEAYVGFALENPMHYQLLFMTCRPEVMESDTALDAASQEAYGFLLQTCAEGIAQGQFRPELDDPHEVAQILWAACHGLVSLRIAKRDQTKMPWRDVRRTSTHLREAVLRGLLRDSPA